MCLHIYLSVRLYFWHADNSAVSASIEIALAQNESCVFEDHRSILQAYRNHHSLTGVQEDMLVVQVLIYMFFILVKHFFIAMLL